MEWLIAVITICAAVVTIIWFVRDIRKENSKVLKAILDAQKGTLEIQEEVAEIQQEMAKEQRAGFKVLAEIGERSSKALVAIAEINERGFETLAKILAKIEAK